MTYEEAVEIIEDALRDYSADELGVLDTVRAHVWAEGAADALDTYGYGGAAEYHNESYNPYLEDENA